MCPFNHAGGATDYISSYRYNTVYTDDHAGAAQLIIHGCFNVHLIIVQCISQYPEAGIEQHRDKPYSVHFNCAGAMN